MDVDNTHSVPIKDLKVEEGANELLRSANMKPYVKLAEAVVSGTDPAGALQVIADLPLEKRYVWRIASALKWGFADFDDLGVTADRETLRTEDSEKLADLLQHRPIQFCLFLKALFGEGQMERVMTQAVAVAKRSG
ncbi:MAG TPA: hypothetical protein VM120_21915 [Bryobacteraceae bacterium]|nr:hypothetical protein [Bryobacteraceae bacterium]